MGKESKERGRGGTDVEYSLKPLTGAMKEEKIMDRRGKRWS